MINGHHHHREPMTDLDKRLQEMACINWRQFVALIGDDALIAAKICILRQGNKSLGEISQKLSITYRQSEYGCKKCEISPPITPGADQSSSQKL